MALHVFTICITFFPLPLSEPVFMRLILYISISILSCSALTLLAGLCIGMYVNHEFTITMITVIFIFCHEFQRLLWFCVVAVIINKICTISTWKRSILHKYLWHISFLGTYSCMVNPISFTWLITSGKPFSQRHLNLIIRKVSPDCQLANRLCSRCVGYMGRDGMAKGSAHVMFLLCRLAVGSVSVKW